MLPERFGPERNIDRTKVINEIAKNVFTGWITDDNPSDTNGLTSLEQILYLQLGIDNPMEMDQAKKEVNDRILDLRGGCDLSFEDPIDL